MVEKIGMRPGFFPAPAQMMYGASLITHATILETLEYSNANKNMSKHEKVENLILFISLPLFNETQLFRVKEENTPVS